jgi:hypothetical protein
MMRLARMTATNRTNNTVTVVLRVPPTLHDDETSSYVFYQAWLA